MNKGGDMHALQFISQHDEEVEYQRIPEQNLIAAIVARALADITNSDLRVARDAWYFVFGKGKYARGFEPGKGFSFHRCCQILRLNHSGVLRAIEKIYPAPPESTNDRDKAVAEMPYLFAPNPRRRARQR